MSAEGLLAFLAAAGFRTHKSESALWYEAGPRFWLASPSHTAIDVSAGELRAVIRATGAFGLRYVAADAGGGRHSFQMTASGADYSLDRLAANARSKIRRGLKRNEIRPISGSELKEAGKQAFLETLDRQNRAKSYPLDKWHRLLDAVDEEPGVEIWSAWYEGELAAYLMVFLIEDVCEFYQGRSRNALLKHYPNNALTYFLTEEMLARRGLREVTYGIESLEETKSVDAFKLSMGYEKQAVRQQIVFHPAIDLALRAPGIGRAVQWMGTRNGAPSYWRKAYGLLNFAGRAGNER